MSNELKEGIQLTQIIYSEDSQHNIGAGIYGCKSIVVVEQCGQMGMVPWAMVFFEHKPPELVNLSMVQSVTLLEAPK